MRWSDLGHAGLLSTGHKILEFMVNSIQQLQGVGVGVGPHQTVSKNSY